MLFEQLFFIITKRVPKVLIYTTHRKNGWFIYQSMELYFSNLICNAFLLLGLSYEFVCMCMCVHTRACTHTHVRTHHIDRQTTKSNKHQIFIESLPPHHQHCESRYCLSHWKT